MDAPREKIKMRCALASPCLSPHRFLMTTLLLCAPLAPSAFAALQPLPSTPVEEMTELEEVLALGKLTANIIATAEDRVYRLYNKLNKANRYDVHCGDIPGEPRSRIMRRTCFPDFLRNYVWDPYLRAYAGASRWHGINMNMNMNMTPYRDMNDDQYWMASCSANCAPAYYGPSNHFPVLS